MPDQDVQNLKLEVGLLKKDIDQITILCEKFDLTIDKLNDLSASMAKMLALHEERIEHQEVEDKTLKDLLELRRQDTVKDIKEVHSRITTTDRELSSKIESMEGRLKNQIEESNKQTLDAVQKLAEYQKQHHENTTKRLVVLEKWKWMMVGGGIVLGVVLGNSDFVVKFFGG
jgi:hypothetical protein